MDRAHDANKHEVYILAGEYFPLQQAGVYHGIIFDDYVCDIKEAMQSDAFLGVGCASYRQMREIKANGGKVATSWWNTHYKNAQKILNEEYPKYGLQAPQIDPLLIARADKEQPLSDVIIAPSEQCAETYRQQGLKNVKVVNFGVDSNLYKPSDNAVTDLSFSVLFGSGNWVRKGLPYLLLAWNKLHFNDGMLTVLGTELRQAVYRTKVLGWVADAMVPKVFSKSKIFCFPTLEEGQALVTLQAMASGMPLITTRESGAPIEDGKEGLIIPTRDPDAIAKALTYYHDNPSEIKRMGANARQKAEQMPWSKFGDGVIDVLEEVARK